MMSTDHPPPRRDGRSSPEAPPPEAWGWLYRLGRRAGRLAGRFVRWDAASGIVLVLAAAVALAWANSPWSESYQSWCHLPLGLRVGDLSLSRSLQWLVNDGLMAVFFFVVGLEIRHELHGGVLSSWRRAAVPVAAALGGMLVPAGLYLALCAGAPSLRGGWGIPVATDIAFALGILSLLGARVPGPVRVLLLALAVIDDLGAIVVIAIFYSSGVAPVGLGVAAGALAVLLALRGLGVRAKLAYLPPSVALWAGIYAAGIHPTIAGVVVGLLTPVRAWFGADGFRARVEEEDLGDWKSTPPESAALLPVLDRIAVAGREATSPAARLVRDLNPWVTFGIMPLFALVNAGVPLAAGAPDAESMRLMWAVTLGLVVGKPLGVLGASWLAVRLGGGELPAGVSGRHLAVLGAVAGVGFTMALFIAQLAFSSASHLAAAKLGVLLASGVAALGALALGRLLLPAPVPTTASSEPTEHRS